MAPASSCHLSRLLRRAFMKKLLTVLSSSPSCWEMVICSSLDGRLFSLNIAWRVRRWTSVKTSLGFLGVLPRSFPCSCSFLLHAAREHGRGLEQVPQGECKAGPACVPAFPGLFQAFRLLALGAGVGAGVMRGWRPGHGVFPWEVVGASGTPSGSSSASLGLTELIAQNSDLSTCRMNVLTRAGVVRGLRAQAQPGCLQQTKQETKQRLRTLTLLECGGSSMCELMLRHSASARQVV